MTDGENVRVVQGTSAEIVALQRQERTPQQQQNDATFDKATEMGDASLESAKESLAWMETMGEIPVQFRNMPVLLGQWKAWIMEQRRIKQ